VERERERGEKETIKGSERRALRIVANKAERKRKKSEIKVRALVRAYRRCGGRGQSDREGK